jgi:hypothetical protein
MSNYKEMKIRLSKMVIAARKLDEEREKAWDDIRQLQMELWPIETGFNIGDIVEVKAGREWVKGKITGLKIKWSQPYPIIQKINKGGEVGQRYLHLWNKEDLRKIESEQPAEK